MVVRAHLLEWPFDPLAVVHGADLHHYLVLVRIHSFLQFDALLVILLFDL